MAHDGYALTNNDKIDFEGNQIKPHQQPHRIYRQIFEIDTSNECKSILVEVDSLIYDYSTHKAYYYIVMQTLEENDFSDAFFSVTEDEEHLVTCLKYSNFLHKDITVLMDFIESNIVPIITLPEYRSILIEPTERIR